MRIITVHVAIACPDGMAEKVEEVAFSEGMADAIAEHLANGADTEQVAVEVLACSKKEEAKKKEVAKNGAAR